MAKNKAKPILSNEVISKWGKMAKINESLTQRHLQMEGGEEEEEEHEGGEEEAFPPAEDSGEMPPAESPMPPEGAEGMEGGAVPEAQVTELVQAIADTIQATTGVPVSVEGAGAGAGMEGGEMGGEEALPPADAGVPPPAPEGGEPPMPPVPGEEEELPLKEGEKMSPPSSPKAQAVKPGLVGSTGKVPGNTANKVPANLMQEEEVPVEEGKGKVPNAPKPGAAKGPKAQTIDKGLLENDKLMEELVNRVYARLTGLVKEALAKKTSALKK